MSDREILNLLINHFPREIGSAAVMRDIKTCDGFITLLQQFSDAEKGFKRKWSGNYTEDRFVSFRRYDRTDDSMNQGYKANRYHREPDRTVDNGRRDSYGTNFRENKYEPRNQKFQNRDGISSKPFAGTNMKQRGNSPRNYFTKNAGPKQSYNEMASGSANKEEISNCSEGQNKVSKSKNGV